VALPESDASKIIMLQTIVNYIREIESAPDIKKNEMENKTKYTKEDLATMDLAITRMKETATMLKGSDEMQERLNHIRLICMMYDWLLCIIYT